ncbi:(3R)-3-hydroxyacyl-CoA dehydrogenase-like [Homalodisca vitripennis]|uniref:(3R)-3-hydroxyacyl-CoA dehydrogenase-like n=1 Tax=Homalodisca vitripennis TaxID=197043 RepID=UPI001EEAA4D3|nr:(3R)-3-hydroxyacyl-CoA dehydrogenase-like [Homalodisca vitripennis]KAG8321164.1 hypothetical protein J6590_051441 [Homalodisca vitripennis]
MAPLVQGSLALVTGASSGIGRETCKVLAREGATVVVTCIDEAGAKETLKLLQGSNHMVMKYDVSDFNTAAEVVKAIVQKYNRPPNILVNCAGIVKFTPVLEETPESFQRIIDVNLKGAFFTSQAVCRELIAAKLPGSIINIASMTGHRGFIGMSPYASSKTGIEAVTRCMSKDMSPYNIRVNDVQPGMIDTAMAAATTTEMVEGWVNQCATRRKGQPEEVAEVIVFLASERSSYVNGAHVPVAAGF